jgi:YD repeat-containing protein
MMLAIEAGSLWVRTPAGQLGFELIPTGPSAFYTRQADATVTFERDADGQVVAMLLQMRGREMRHPRVL